jgi:molybdopterin molybdotransferase
MPEFLTLLPPPTALQVLLEQLTQTSSNWSFKNRQIVNTIQALGRVTAEVVVAQHPLPSFHRSTVDGYAVRAADTFGANEGLPAYLALVGESPMGDIPDFALEVAECALIHTGGMLPETADAVVMIENTQLAQINEVEILRAVAVGENVLKIGEDVREGEIVIPAGTRLRPADIGGLMALGRMVVSVSRPPRVAILSTGDEVVSPDRQLLPGQVRDINTYSLSALVRQLGGEPQSFGILPDQPSVLREAAEAALTSCDVVVITAGSSASTRDLTADVINDLGSPGVLVHGVDVRPGKPTILGVCQGKAVIGLPGNPVSALVIAQYFLTPILEILLGIEQGYPKPVVRAQLNINLASQAGREDWIPVRLVEGQAGFLAEPVFGKSNLIFSLVRADGLIRIPPDATGLPAGETVEVFMM